MPANPIPDDYRGATPYLSINGAARAIAFYKEAFGAVETERLADATGKIMHAEMLIGTARIMLADEFPVLGFRSPQSLGGTPVVMHIYVEDVDAFIARAAATGVKVLRPPRDEFYGDRAASVLDPFGHMWGFATRKEDLSSGELRRRFDEISKQPAGSS
jgi:PhnB protein